MNFTEYVETKKKEARIANIEEVRREIDRPWVKEKIHNQFLVFFLYNSLVNVCLQIFVLYAFTLCNSVIYGIYCPKECRKT